MLFERIPVTLITVILLPLVIVTSGFLLARRRPSYPPGPPRSLISGSRVQPPVCEPWRKYAELGKKYKPVTYLRFFTKEIVLLNSLTAAMDLLDSRSAIYSDRPQKWFLHEYLGRKYFAFNISSENPRFKTYRKLLVSGLNSRAIQQYQDTMDGELCALLLSLTKTPDEFIAHIRRYANGLVLKLAYGWTVKDNNDPLMQLMEGTVKLATDLSRPGRYLVDTFPVLRFLPFMRFKRDAVKYMSHFITADNTPWEWVKEQMATGRHCKSFAYTHLSRLGDHEDAELVDSIKWCSSGVHAGGVDTTIGTLRAFFLLMCLNPSAQRKAQVEIDQHCGGRLVTQADEPMLPYVSALVKEVLRWGPVAPLGLPHRVIQDDIYEGYKVPKGATVLANIWAMTHDENIYPDPETFCPERFLPTSDTEPQLDPQKIVFGFGRRVCPGVQFAKTSLFMAMANILATLTISPKQDRSGNPVIPEAVYTSTVTSCIMPFPCQITARNPQLCADLENRMLTPAE